MEMAILIDNRDILEFQTIAETAMLSTQRIQFSNIKSNHRIPFSGGQPEGANWIEILNIARDNIVLILPLLLLWLGKGKKMSIRKADGTKIVLQHLTEKACYRILETVLNVAGEKHEKGSKTESEF